MRNSKRNSPSSPGSPGCAKRGVWCAAVAQDETLPVSGEVCNQFAFGGAVGLGQSARPLLGQIKLHRPGSAGVANDPAPAHAGLEDAGFFSGLRKGGFARADVRRQLPHERPAGDLDDQVFSRGTIHAFAQAHGAVLCNQARLIILRDEIVKVVVGFQDHLAAAAAVAAAGSSLGTILLALERHATLAAMAGARVNLDLVNKHFFNRCSRRQQAVIPKAS